MRVPNIFQEAFALWRRSRREKTSPMQLRLLAFFGLFAVFVLGICFLVLAMLGVLNIGENESRVWLENESTHLFNDVSADFGTLSSRGTNLAGKLSAAADDYFSENGLRPDELGSHPWLINGLLSAEMPSLLSFLENNYCSAAFIVLEATVNPLAESAENSRAGVFLKRNEPNVLNAPGSKVHFLRGPAAVAREYGIELLGQWRMEFDIRGAPFQEELLKTARENPDLPLSRLYYWTDRFLLKRNSEPGLLLCLPLRAADGTVFGLCGLEVGAMQFKRQYSPDNSLFPRAFAMLSPLEGGVLDSSLGLIAGNSYLTNQQSAQRISVLSQSASGPSRFRWEGGEYVGTQMPLKLYPAGSLHEGQPWALAVLLPREDWQTAANRNNALFYGCMLAILAASLLLALTISRRSIRPVISALELIRADGSARPQRTQIAEIDDLLLYLDHLDEQRGELAAKLEAARRHPAEPSQGPPPFAAYERFTQNIATLTAAEHAVFNLYMQGYTAQAIASDLFVSINTVKFHNKNIYAKLGISSRKELLLYARMLREGENPLDA
ncbi:MAG: helix-turn-helix transcriptional regulator [Christensenellaceae bacterium]|nr:helix-turn-helix transcriptional regulator [Christensenellaceae bacterium]